MGNSLPVFLGNSGSPRFPCRLQLGRSAAIDSSTTVEKDSDDGGHSETWKVSYIIDGSTCDVSLKRYVGKDGNVNIVSFKLNDKVYLECGCLFFAIQRTESGFLKLSGLPGMCVWFESKMSMKTSSRAGVGTLVYLYGGSGNRGGLVVLELEREKNSTDNELNSVTVAHYFANSSGTTFNRTETDIGLSVIAKIRSSNGKLDITVDGPEQHPSSALFYLFDEVNRTGFWKPSMCPHCANTRRQLSRMLCQSDSEESDGVPVPPRRASRPTATTVSNNGRLRDGNEPNMSKLCVFVFHRRQRAGINLCFSDS